MRPVAPLPAYVPQILEAGNVKHNLILSGLDAPEHSTALNDTVHCMQIDILYAHTNDPGALIWIQILSQIMFGSDIDMPSPPPKP